jgi:phospholipid/cholesterol/gamma-HCH transport system substrate-binding protein
MALFRRSSGPRDPGMTPFRAGLVAIVVIAVFTYFGFTKANPFASPYELKAVFATTNGLKSNSPVRVAGVEVGRVVKVEGIGGSQAAKVTMEIKKKALPLHRDAQLKIRSRIFLEGNFFVDIESGTPESPVLHSGDTVPMQQTSTPVQLGDVVRVLNSDTRGDLQTFLDEYSLKGLGDGGAEAFNRTIPFMERAYKSTALVNDALLGSDPAHDTHRVLRGTQRVAAALTVDEEALKNLVTNLNTTAGAIASEDTSLEASIPALRDTLRAGMPALASLNGALPSLRAFAIEALPGVRSSKATIDDALPFIHQTRLLMRRSELRGLAKQLRRHIPSIVTLNLRLIPLLAETRTVSRCANQVLVPFFQSPIPSNEPGNSGNLVREQVNRSLVGLAGESRTTDANTSWFRVQGVNPANLAAGKVEPAPPPDPHTPPPHRPDLPCETQDAPNLAAPDPPGAALKSTSRRSTADSRRRTLELIRSDRFKRMVEQARKRLGLKAKP